MFVKEFKFFDNEINNMKTDIIKNDTGYQVITDLPGYTKSDISLEYFDGKLIIKVIKKIENEKNEYVLKERGNNNIERSFYFGDVIDKENIKAKMENGVLYINLTLNEDLKKNINIE